MGQPHANADRYARADAYRDDYAIADGYADADRDGYPYRDGNCNGDRDRRRMRRRGRLHPRQPPLLPHPAYADARHACAAADSDGCAHGNRDCDRYANADPASELRCICPSPWRRPR